MKRRASIVIEKDENGFFAWHPFNCGMEGTIANITEAIELYLETLPPDDRAGLLKS